jgi:hypothetical protein
MTVRTLFSDTESRGILLAQYEVSEEEWQDLPPSVQRMLERMWK